MLWLYLHFPSLQLDNSDDQFSELAVAIICPRQYQLLQVNKVAEQAGLYPGMGLATAAALCHSLKAIPYCRRKSRQALSHLANRLYQVTSDISLYPPDGLLFRVSPMLRIYGGLEAYWQKVKGTLPAWLNYHYACAETPLAARLLAHAQTQLITNCSDRIQQALNQISVDRLDCDHKTQSQLIKVGVRTVGALLTIPPDQLTRRFDKAFMHYLFQLSGRLPHPVNWYQPPGYFQVELELLYECDNSKRLARPIKKLLEQLTEYWISRDKTSQHIRYVLLMRDAPAYCLDVHAAEASRCAEFWLKLTELKLETVNLPAPVYAIHLICHQLQPYHADNGSLVAPQQSGNVAILLSRLLSKLGHEGVLTPILKDDYRPEVRNAYQPASKSPQQLSLARQLRPSLLLSPPIPLMKKLRIVQGPERLVTGWWDHSPIHRDYFIATSDEGRWLWIYRTPDKQWYIHGFFS
ncbi:hypothetical protein HMF8227_00041 [Saliniradius amylolyticus]|uniref:UmuC domain-containing protein n=1 Tax=Saliniradius amylolyticus TaxID=2183582 RepID=A0A2S2DYW6_9ALTE|nr:DNA polymerase Y family protein [Saliniradius amylolyticus]AWL10549.1 hypothetical protein HMF8227_00041 [Saliniradius amylolyticus]